MSVSGIRGWQPLPQTTVPTSETNTNSHAAVAAQSEVIDDTSVNRVDGAQGNWNFLPESETDSDEAGGDDNEVFRGKGFRLINVDFYYIKKNLSEHYILNNQSVVISEV